MKLPRAVIALFWVATAARAAAAPSAPEHWVGAWACSPQLADAKNQPPGPGLAGYTVRQIIRVTLGGRRLRLRLSNVFGDGALALASVHVARAAGDGAIDSATDRAFTFAGAGAATIPRGAPLVTDPVDFPVAAGTDLAITLQVASAPRDLTTHSGSRTTSYFAPGNFVAATALPHPLAADHWFFIEGLDVLAGQPSAAAVVILGDSITDGRGSTTNGNDRWTDQLARRFQSGVPALPVAILNEGIGGNRLLRDGLGPNGLARFDRDVIAQTGVRWLIVFEGINDLGTAVAARARGEPAATALDIVHGYEQCIARAHAHGIRVFGATLTAFHGFKTYDAERSEADRQEINRWIRSSGRFDAVIDFDAATRDPAQPLRLNPAFDSSDHLHLNPAGYARMAGAVDLALFQ